MTPNTSVFAQREHLCQHERLVQQEVEAQSEACAVGLRRIAGLQQELLQAEACAAEWQQKARDVVEDRDRKADEVDRKADEVDKLVAAQQGLMQDLATRTSNDQAASELTASLQRDLEVAGERAVADSEALQQLRQDRSATVQERDALTAKVAALEQQLAASQASWQDRLQTLQAEVQQAGTLATVSSMQVERLQAALSKREDRIAELSSEARTMSSQRLEAQALRDGAVAEADSSRARLQQLQQELNQATGRLKAMDARLQGALAAADGQAAAAKAAEDKSAALAADLESAAAVKLARVTSEAQQRVAAAEAARDELASRVEACNRSAADQGRELAAVQADATALRAETLSLEQAHQGLQQIKAELQEQLLCEQQQHCLAKEQLQAECDRTRELSSVRGENERLLVAVREAETITTDLQQRLHKLQVC